MAVTTQKFSGRVLRETQAGGQVVQLAGGADQMTFWGAQRADGAKAGDAVIVHRADYGATCSWWAVAQTEEDK